MAQTGEELYVGAINHRAVPAGISRAQTRHTHDERWESALAS